METFFVDTNIFIRFLTKDDPKKAVAVRNLFARAVDGKIKLVTNELVIAEMVWTLESYYEIPKSVIQEKISLLLQSEAFEIPNRDLLFQALAHYVQLNVDYIDAYNAVWVQQQSLSLMVSYDKKHMKRFAFLEVKEP